MEEKSRTESKLRISSDSASVAEQPQKMFNNTASPQVKHAGRAHVRGKIRPVWRPRYMEVADNGLVHYYELPPSADISLHEDSDWDHVHMIPKCTLIIHHARIIDVTTLRDLHVWLPRGAYGFLFHGQRLESGNESSNSLFYKSTTGGCSTPQGNSRPSLSEPRDFLCAVSTLEEAQMWVVALQWAASTGKESGFTFSIAASPTSLFDPWASEDSWERVFKAPRPGSGSQFWSMNSMLQQPKKSRSAKKEVITPKTRDALVESTLKKATAMKQQQATSSGGKIVVPKVISFSLVRVADWQWDIAFRIQLLLVQPSRLQQWGLMRTAYDLKRLLLGLQGSSHSEAARTKIRDHACLIETLPSLATDGKKFYPPRREELKKSIQALDEMMKDFCMEGTIMNSPVMKQFLGLQRNSNSSIGASVFFSVATHIAQLHDPHAITGEKISWKTQDAQQSSDSTNQFVRGWILKQNQATDHFQQYSAKWFVFAMFLALHPLIPMGCLGLPLFLLISLVSKLFPPTVTIRVDLLITSWVGAAALGWMHRKESAPSTTEERVSSKTKELRKLSISDSQEDGMEETVHPSDSRRASDVLSSSSDDDDAGLSKDDDETDGDVTTDQSLDDFGGLSSPLPECTSSGASTPSSWSRPKDTIFHVRGLNYLTDRVKVPSGKAPFTCRGVDIWITDYPERHIARHPSVLGGNLAKEDTFMVNFLLPFGNFVSYFSIPPIEEFPNKELAGVWTRFLRGDQQYRDARLKMLPVVMDGPWIVKTAVGSGKSPALLGKVIPLQYFFSEPTETRKAIYEVDVIISASSIAKGILSVVKGHTKNLTIAFAFIIEAAEQSELPENILCCFQVNALHLEDCPLLPPMPPPDSPLDKTG